MPGSSRSSASPTSRGLALVVTAFAMKLSAVAIALAGCSGGATRPAAPAQGPADALALSVKVVADTTVEIALTNTGSKPRWLRARLDVDDIDIKPVGDSAVISECRGCETIDEGQGKASRIAAKSDFLSRMPRGSVKGFVPNDAVSSATFSATARLTREIPEGVML
jgi:hypothetical protein